MKKMIAGVPISKEDRDQAIHDFKCALAHCATMTFRISCARSYSGLEVNQGGLVLFITSFGESIWNGSNELIGPLISDCFLSAFSLFSGKQIFFKKNFLFDKG